MKIILPVLAISCLVPTFAVVSAERRFNSDENKAGDYTLPSLLGAATTREAWENKRREEVLELFLTQMFGRTPEIPSGIAVTLRSEKKDALGGLATRKLLHVTLPSVPKWQGMEVMLYLPTKATRPAPVFVGLSFGGNHAVSKEADIPISDRWMRESKNEGAVVSNKATELSRGGEAARWPLEMILGKGYAVATAYYGDVEPDHALGWKDGLRGAASAQGPDTVWKEDDWGAIGAWSFGLSRILDAVVQDSGIDAKRCAVIGHSRLGKTSLWAGAQDVRFGLVISNNSGEGGAAIMRRDMGETVKIITTSFPHWFCGKFSSYSEPNTHLLPLDSHMLIALAAPRGIYVASAVEDEWADPKGEFIATREAKPVYDLFDLKGVEVTDQPTLHTPVGHQVRYHIRAGKHDVTDYDWEQYLKAADELLK